MQQQLGRWTPQGGGSLHIGQGRRAFGRQNGDAAGKERQRLLLIRIKQPLLLEAFSQLGQPQQQTVAAFSTFSFDPRSNSRRPVGA